MFDGAEDDETGYGEKVSEAAKDHKQWGFTILRCTYDSQTDWDAFLKRFLEDIDANLRFEWETTLRPNFQFRVVEEPERLNNISWRQARAQFTTLNVEDIRQSHPNVTDAETKLLQRDTVEDNSGLPRPYREYFIYADRDSVASVINCGRTWRDAQEPGNYYFTLVLALHKEVIASGYDGTSPLPCEEGEEEDWPMKRFKVDHFLEVYSLLLDYFWDDFHTKDDGICS